MTTQLNKTFFHIIKISTNASKTRHLIKIEFLKTSVYIMYYHRLAYARLNSGGLNVVDRVGGLCFSANIYIYKYNIH